MEYVLVFSLIFNAIDYVVSGELCPFQTYDGIILFGQTVKFSYCRQGCCGNRLHDVCCTGPPVYLIIGCVSGGAVLVIAVIITACFVYIRSKNNTRHVIRASVYPGVFHTEPSHESPETDSYDIYHPPSYDVVTSGQQEKPPCYVDAIRLGMDQSYLRDESIRPCRGTLRELDDQ